MRRYVYPDPMPAALVSQGDLGDINDRELKWSQEKKAWIGKEEVFWGLEIFFFFFLETVSHCVPLLSWNLRTSVCFHLTSAGISLMYCHILHILASLSCFLLGVGRGGSAGGGC